MKPILISVIVAVLVIVCVVVWAEIFSWERRIAREQKRQKRQWDDHIAE